MFIERIISGQSIKQFQKHHFTIFRSSSDRFSMIFIYFHDRIDFPRPSIPESMSFSLPGDAMAKAAALSAAKDLGDAKEVEELLQAGRQLSRVIVAWKVRNFRPLKP